MMTSPEALTFDPTTRSIRKRDGTTVQTFDVDKIERAIAGAWKECFGKVDENGVRRVVRMVLATMPEGIVDIETIQNAVEVAIMRCGHFDVVKAYILYRHQRTEARALRGKAPDPKAMSDYIHVSKYARFRPDLGRREVYAETVQRVEEMHAARFPELRSEIQDAFDLVREQRVLPSMRSMQFAGPAILKNHCKLYNCVGVETQFITRNGVKRFSDFKDGDETVVLTHTGKWKKARVSSFGQQQLFTIRIGRNRSSHTIRATRDHTWLLDDGRRTQDLGVKNKLAKAPRLVGAWDYCESNPEERMYWSMGYVYGDGTLVKDRDGEYKYSMVRLCGDDGRFLERFKELGFKCSNPPSYGGDAVVYTGKYLKTLPTIEKDGFENVMAFVRGYLDADGHKTGDWPSPFKGIQATGGESIDFIRNVFPTVGAYITREDDLTGQETNYGIRPETICFGLVLGFGDSPASPYSVQEIETSTVETVWCLEVEDDHSFVMPNGIVTGNCCFSLIDRLEAFSEAMFLLLCGCGVGYSVQNDHVEKLPPVGYVDPKKIRHHVVADTIEGWADALKALLKSYQDGVYLELSYHLIRPAGAPLVTSGGKAPGHTKLKESLEAVREVLNGAQGRQLRPIECHRVLCHAADTALSGGIRRSAMICLFSLDDSEMMICKTGNWFEREPWFANANNSVALRRDEAKKKQFLRIFAMTKQWGEPGFYFVNDNDYGVNPCVPAGTKVLTRNGYFPIEMLVGKKTAVWNGIEWCETTPRETGRDQPIVRVYLSDGTSLDCTDYHEWCIATGKWSKDHVEERVKAKDLEVGDVLMRYDMPVLEGGVDMPHAYTHGFYTADGTLETAAPHRRDAQLYGIKQSLVKYLDCVKVNEPQVERDRTLVTLPADMPAKFYVPLHASVRSRLDWLAGLCDGDGTIVRNPKSINIQIGSINLPFLREVRLMLTTLGVQAKIGLMNEGGMRPLPDGRGGEKEYLTQDCYRLLINATDAHLLVQLGLKTHRLDLTLAQEKPQRDARRFVTVLLVERRPPADVVYCFTEESNHTGTFEGIVTGQCGEVGLNPRLVIDEKVKEKLARRDVQVQLGDVHTGWAFCNLCEINAAKFTSLDDFLVAAHAATFIGTLQATYTRMPYLGWVSEALAEREALLGVGMTGMLDAPEVACNPEYQRVVAHKVKEWNATFASWLGIEPAARTTLVKPSGTTSLELGCVAPGQGAHHARRYIRRVTADGLESVFQAFRKVNPGMCVQKPDSKWVIEFPVEAPASAIVKADLTAIQFAEMVRSTQENWVLPGTGHEKFSPGLTHNVSNTIHVKDDEWPAVAEYLWDHRDHFTGVSLLPALADTMYAFAPNQEITTEADEARWNSLLTHYTPIDYTALVETTDETTFTSEPACAGGACLV